MVRWLTCLLSIGNLIGQDDALPPNFVYLEPIEDFYERSQIELEIIVTDRNDIEEVVLYYRFTDDIEFRKQKMHVSYQPVIFNVVIPLDEVDSGFIQFYFWAKDEYDNGATWPSGGEDMPIILPVYPLKEKGKTKVEVTKLVEGFQPPEELEDNLPYYLEIGMLAPFLEINQEEGVPIVVISVFDSEEIVDLESVKLIVDGDWVSSFNSRDMITYIPQDPFDPGYHIIRYEAKNNVGEILFKEFSFFMHKKIIDEAEIKKTSWKDAIKFKGNLGWNTNYDPSPNRPIDTHKINSLVKFQLGEFKFNLSGLMNTHLYDADAREKATHRQPSSRVKFKMNSPYIDFHYGDNTPEFSEFSLKGTRVRGISTKLRWGTWETSFVSGETKHWVNSETTTNLINIWDTESTYQLGDKVYDNSITWIVIVENTVSEPCVFSEDTCAANPDWTFLEESEFSAISNDVCTAVEPAMYGLNPDTSRIGIAFGETMLGDGGGFYWFWDGSSCKEELIYSSINMLTGEDGIAMGKLFITYDACRYSCTIPVQYEKGSQIRYLQGFRTSKDFFEHAKFGISAIRSWDVRDENLTPYSIFHKGYIYEGNIAAAGDFSFHFNNDKTVLSGEYGLSMTIDQTFSDTLLLRNISKIPESLSLYSYADWSGVDYCYQNDCVDINGDGDTIQAPKFVEGAFKNDTLWAEYTSAKNKMNDFAKILGFALNDDINGYAEGRGVSGLTGPELVRLIEGGFDSLYLLLKRPAIKVAFKTPIPLNFTELNFQTEFNQAPLNYLSHGSSSIQTDVRNWKNKVAFKLLKNQVSFSFGYDNQIKSPWDPESELDGEIKRSITNTKSGSIGLSFRNWPGINYSIRLQERKDLAVQMIELFDSTFTNDSSFTIDSTLLLQQQIVGQKKLTTHTIAPTYKINIGDIGISLNGNITVVNDLDELSDTTGCYEMLNSTKGEEWGGIKDTSVCGNDVNQFYFEKADNPLRDSGTYTSTYTSALSFSFPFPLSLNLGWGMSVNSPNDLRQSKTVISVFSTKLGYKFLDKKLNVTIGGNYVIGHKSGNEFWDSGEVINSGDGEEDSEFNQGDTFIDKVELDNNKLTLKCGLQYKIPEPNITIGLNLNYTKAADHLKIEQDDPVFKAKLAIKFGF
ncbi:hypothetical protein HX837_05780 [Marine Group I thaumarchaeote]|uniref:Uncharacterized protein n=1 Tax=Marine Group I thaumarchaeote TaxID=2511932 RepID=A0A7K4MQ42_9ARCH|nr:hypothetical protein [Marine Group I thaumarchaeote]